MEYKLKLKEEEFSSNYFKHFKDGLPKRYKITGKNQDIRFLITNESFEIHSPDLVIRKSAKQEGYFVPIMVKRGVVDLQTSDEDVVHIVGYFDYYTDESKLFNIADNQIHRINDVDLIENIQLKVKGGEEV